MAIRPDKILAQARQILQDTVAGVYRYPDSDLIDSINTALREVKRIRPDLFIGLNFVVPTVTAGNIATPLALEDTYETPFILFVVGMAELRDDQFTQDARAAMAMTRFTSMLTQAG